MADAGKVMILPKGDYDSTASYEIYDSVHKNGVLYVAKGPVSNIDPETDIDPATGESTSGLWVRWVDFTEPIEQATEVAIAEATEAATQAAADAQYYAGIASQVTEIDIATTQKAGIVKPDGTTILVDQDGTMHGAAQVDIATEQTAGTVKPDGTTITIDQDGTIHGSTQVEDASLTEKGIVKLSNATNSDSEDEAATSKAVKIANDNAKTAQDSVEELEETIENNTLNTIADIVANNDENKLTGALALKEFLTEAGAELAMPTNVTLVNKDESVLITWTDPDDLMANGEVKAKWSGTVVVRKAGAAPQNRNDGIIILDSKVRNQYETVGFLDTGLTNGQEYYYGIFPYSTLSAYTYDCVRPFTPQAIYPSKVSNVQVIPDDTKLIVTFDKDSTVGKVKCVCKAGSAPADSSDGAVIDNFVSGMNITGLTNGITYYVMLYSYTAVKERETAGDPVSAIPAAFAATIDVTYPAGATLTCTDGVSTLTAATTTGEYQFTVPNVGNWTVKAQDGSVEASTVIQITQDGQSESCTLRFFTATIDVSYPAGSTLTCSDGTTTLTALTTTGTYQFVVRNTGNWTVEATDGELTDSKVIAIEADGDAKTCTLKYFAAYIDVTFTPGASVTATKGTKSYTAGLSTGTYRFTVHEAGEWTITATMDEYTETGTANITADEQVKSVDVHFFTVTLNVTYPAGSTMTGSNGSKSISAPDTSGTAQFTIHDSGTWTLNITNGSQTATQDVVLNTDGETKNVTMSYFSASINVTYPAGSTLTCTKSSVVQTAGNTSGTWQFNVTETGTYTLNITDGSQTATKDVTITTNGQTEAVSMAYVRIYGVEWDGTSTTKWTRTDDAAGFTDPVPYVAGATQYGSPFDSLYPWSGMVKSERTGGTMVAIPKFWYKLTKNGNKWKIQIADKAVEGFHISPAHMDRGDSKGERDTVYIGRYHCHESDYKSKTGGKPKANITRSNFRSSIHGLGNNIWSSDFATRFTLWLLYLVEFADWNSQKTIGKGCGNGSGTENMGYTDSMPYHTGTTQASRDTFGLGTQYRNIEGLWDNVRDWCDGCYYNGSGLNIILNPANFSDSSGGILAGAVTAGSPPSGYDLSDVTGLFPMFLSNGNANDGSYETYACDQWYFYSGYPCLYVGGDYNQVADFGMFFVNAFSATSKYAVFGARLLELP